MFASPCFSRLTLVASALLVLLAGCGPGDLSVRASTDRDVSSVNVTLTYMRGDERTQRRVTIPLDEQGQGVLDVPDEVSYLSVSMAMSQPRERGRSSMQRPGNTTLELLDNGEVIDTSTTLLPSVQMRAE